MSVAFVFPGQGSQSVGMLDDLVASHPIFDEKLAQASHALGLNLAQIVKEGPEASLNQTEITQPALLTMSVALYEAWISDGGSVPAAMAGHSLGEYSALTVAGALDFEVAVRLVHERGKLMQSAVPLGEGAMAAVLGLEDDQLSELCEQVDEVVSPANYNSPGQVVIAGAVNAVERVAVLAKEAGARRVVMLDVSVPSHCELMTPASDGVERLLREAQFTAPTIPVYQNFDGEPAEDTEEIREKLVRQLSHPVRWSTCISSIVRDGTTAMMECGPGKVLTGLMRRIDRSITGIAIGDSSSFQNAKQEVN